MDTNSILIIDDDELTVKLIQTALSPLDCAIHVAHEESPMIEQIQEVHPKILILDLALPRVSGFEILAMLREMPDLADMKIIICSALADRCSPADLEQVSLILPKPFSTRELREGVSSLL